MDSSGTKGRDTQGSKPPPGYPSGGRAAPKKPGRHSTKKKGEASFIEGCLAALCCCWLCETCCY